jgi:hypothetical protein
LEAKKNSKIELPFAHDITLVLSKFPRTRFTTKKTQRGKKIMKINELKEIKVGEPVDLTEYVNQDVLIDKLDVVEVNSIYSETGKAMCLKVSSEPLTSIEYEGETIEIRASELYNLKMDEDGNWGYSSSPRSKLQQLMRKFKVSNPKDLIGKKLKTRLREKTNNDATSVQFLGFVL